ncbi:MAG: hypothetical protein K0Q74_207 [Gammaproteobacteria bacterium]|jgi:hypothetical protein|nr:hypothetical protein [Gammaproteobacteria bacterium]
MKKILWGIVISLLISGCASVQNHQPISTDNRVAMKGKAITYTMRKNPDFIAWTPGAHLKQSLAFGIFGIGGAVASASLVADSGNKIVNSYHLHDPAKLIAAGLSENLKTAHGSGRIMPPIYIKNEKNGKSNNINKIADAAKDVPYVVDVQTLNWGFHYSPYSFARYNYHVIYKASARILDVQTKAVIASGGCHYEVTDSTKMVSYDAMLANEANYLKNELSLATTQCIKQITQQMLGS